MGYCKNLSRSTLTSAENDQFELIKQNLGLTTNNLNGTFENIDGDCIIIGEREDLCEDFIYDSKQLQDTITSENNLVCDRKWISDIITVTSMIGMVIGRVFQLSDFHQNLKQTKFVKDLLKLIKN